MSAPFSSIAVTDVKAAVYASADGTFTLTQGSNTLIGYGLWNTLLNHYSAATVTPWALLVPVFGMSASAVLLAEPLPWWKLLAMALIFSGLALNMYANRK